MNAPSLLVLAASCSISVAAQRSGKAEADWLVKSAGYQPGVPLQTGIRLKVDEHWHTYWSNPGEGGMKPSITFVLPPGWTAGEFQYPVPKRFSTGGLPGFGYEGTVIFPVTLTPPKEASGPATPVAKISWLTCNDDACIPGRAEIPLTVGQDAAPESPDAPAIDAALAKVPRPLEGARLEVAEMDKNLLLTLRLPPGGKVDAAALDVFPETPEAIDNAATIRFAAAGDGQWTATVPKSEYATGPLKKLVIVLAGGGLGTPAMVIWTAE